MSANTSSGFSIEEATAEQLGFDPNAPWLGRKNFDELASAIANGWVKVYGLPMGSFLFLDIADWAMQLWEPPEQRVKRIELELAPAEGATPEDVDTSLRQWMETLIRANGAEASDDDLMAKSGQNGAFRLTNIKRSEETTKDVQRTRELFDAAGFGRCVVFRADLPTCPHRPQTATPPQPLPQDKPMPSDKALYATFIAWPILRDHAPRDVLEWLFCCMEAALPGLSGKPGFDSQEALSSWLRTYQTAIEPRITDPVKRDAAMVAVYRMLETFKAAQHPVSGTFEMDHGLQQAAFEALVRALEVVRWEAERPMAPGAETPQEAESSGPQQPVASKDQLPTRDEASYLGLIFDTERYIVTRHRKPVSLAGKRVPWELLRRLADARDRYCTLEELIGFWNVTFQNEVSDGRVYNAINELNGLIAPLGIGAVGISGAGYQLTRKAGVSRRRRKLKKPRPSRNRRRENRR